LQFFARAGTETPTTAKLRRPSKRVARTSDKVQVMIAANAVQATEL
jgi:hypothetical protein